MRIIQMDLDLNNISNDYISNLIIEKIKANNEDNKQIESVISNKKNKLSLILPSVFRHFIGDVKDSEFYLGIEIYLKTIYSHIDFNKAYLIVHDKFLSNQYYLNGKSNLTYKNIISLNIKDNEFCLISSDPFATIIDSSCKSVTDNQVTLFEQDNIQVASFEDEKKNINFISKEGGININDIPNRFSIIKQIRFDSLTTYAEEAIGILGNNIRLKLYINNKTFEFVDGDGKDITRIEIYKNRIGKICFSCNANIANNIYLREDIKSVIGCEIKLNLEIPKYFFTNHPTHPIVTLNFNFPKLPKKLKLEADCWKIDDNKIDYNDNYCNNLYLIKVEKK